MSRGNCPPPHHHHRAKLLASKPPSSIQTPLLLETPSALILSQVQCQRLCRGTSPTASEQTCPRLCCSSFHQGETCQANDLTFSGIHHCWGFRWIQPTLFCDHPPPWSTSLDSTCLLTKTIVGCSCLNCRGQDEDDRRLGWLFQEI